MQNTIKTEKLPSKTNNEKHYILVNNHFGAGFLKEDGSIEYIYGGTDGKTIKLTDYLSSNMGD